MRRFAIIALIAFVGAGRAQAPSEGSRRLQSPKASQGVLLSPQAAYERASSPVDIVRRDTGNWSHIELGALQASIAQAKDACEARTTVPYTGSDLVWYARLCSLGKDWEPTYLAATAYINSADSAKPLLTNAYTLQIQADFNLKHEHEAVGACLAMLRSVPYSAESDAYATAAVRYLELAYTDDAIIVAAERQQHLLQLLQAAKDGTAIDARGAQIPIHTLVEHALEFAALAQYDNQPGLAASLTIQLESAVPRELSSDESILVDAAWGRYRLLGTKFPSLPGAVYLMPSSGVVREQPKFGSATVFLVFPAWCAQCVRQATEIVPALVRTAVLKGPGRESDVHIYALLADDISFAQLTASLHPAARAKAVVEKDGRSDSANDAQPTAEQQLVKTPTFVVRLATLDEFYATDFPLLIAADSEARIRLMVPAAPSNALDQGGPIDQLTKAILSNWPPDKESKATKYETK